MTTSLLTRGRAVTVAAPTALALLAAGCTGSSDQSPTSSSAGASGETPSGTATSGISATSGSPGSGTAVSGINWTSCGERLSCADVSVPVDWSNPDGEQVTLAVIRQTASKPDQRIGTGCRAVRRLDSERCNVLGPGRPG